MSTNVRPSKEPPIGSVADPQEPETLQDGLSPHIAAGLLTVLKRECESQHHRAEALLVELAAVQQALSATEAAYERQRQHALEAMQRAKDYETKMEEHTRLWTEILQAREVQLTVAQQALSLSHQERERHAAEYALCADLKASNEAGRARIAELAHVAETLRQDLTHWQTCSMCGERMDQPGHCSEAEAERVAGLNAMLNDTLTRAEQAEGELAGLKSLVGVREEELRLSQERAETLRQERDDLRHTITALRQRPPKVCHIDLTENTVSNVYADLGFTAADHSALLAERDALQAELIALRGHLAALVAKLEAVHADARYSSVWQIAQMHVGPYEGPQYTEEMNAAKRALQAPQETP